ncbi:MAG TPA: hypothetical protein VJ276_25600 [Thermoanaerobaculia bacterium]|nr:hypothetical protein [Thermoanaerobaculia bacterium]
MRLHHWERRTITLVLLTALGALLVHERNPPTLAIALSAVGALLARIIAFYFPRPRGGRKKPPEAGW